MSGIIRQELAARGARPSRARAAETAPGPRFYPNLGVMLGTATREGVAALRADPRVRRLAGAPPISLIRPSRKAAAKLGGRLTWGLKAMGAGKLWDQGLSGKGVLVGHLDTGVDGKHPALKGAVAHFAEFDDLGREVQPAPAPFDSEDHGTHTAATIAGRPVKSRHVGVAPGCRLASAVVVEGGNVVARVLGGMDWAVGHGVRILSMSLGYGRHLDGDPPHGGARGAADRGLSPALRRRPRAGDLRLLPAAGGDVREPRQPRHPGWGGGPEAARSLGARPGPGGYNRRRARAQAPDPEEPRQRGADPPA
jgi:subtilisin family serine protease